MGNGSSINLNVNTGNLTIGSFIGGLTSSSGDINLTTLSANSNIQIHGNVTSTGNLTLTSGSAGSISLEGTVQASGQTVTLNTPQLTLPGIESEIVSTNGNVNIFSNGANNALNISMGFFAGINANNGNVIFNNSSAPGAITINSGYGFINANLGQGLVILNGGNNGVVNISATTITGFCHR